MKDFGKAVRDQLMSVGCHFLRRGKGDHDIWITMEGKRIVVPVPIKSRHTANGILKDAGLPKVLSLGISRCGGSRLRPKSAQRTEHRKQEGRRGCMIPDQTRSFVTTFEIKPADFRDVNS